MAVGLYLAGLVDHLDLMLPCPFDQATSAFEDTGEYDTFNNPGLTSTFYHRHFSDKMGIDSLAQIAAAITKGAIVEVRDGFKVRNTLVAQADMLIAFTFGNGARCADGGTWDTLRKYLNRGGGMCWHVDLNDMSIHTPARLS
jgi:hypothetical protein